MPEPMTGEEIKAVEDEWQAVLLDVLRAKRRTDETGDPYYAQEVLPRARKWVLVSVLGGPTEPRGNQRRYMTDLAFRVQVDVINQFLAALDDPERALDGARRRQQAVDMMQKSALSSEEAEELLRRLP